MLTSQSITPTRSCFWCAHQMRVKLNDLGRRLPRWRKAFSQRGRRCSRIGRMLASADNAAAPHPVDCVPMPRRPVALRQGHSHPASVALQPEVRPAQAHAAGSGVAPSRAGSYAHPYAWECGQRPFRGVPAPARRASTSSSWPVSTGTSRAFPPLPFLTWTKRVPSPAVYTSRTRRSRSSARRSPQAWANRICACQCAGWKCRSWPAGPRERVIVATGTPRDSHRCCQAPVAKEQAQSGTFSLHSIGASASSHMRSRYWVTSSSARSSSQAKRVIP